MPSFKFHDLHFICDSATPPAQESQKSWQTFISATCLDMFYMCCTLHSLPSGINHKYTHISFEIICGILAIIHSPRLLLLSPHPCALSPPPTTWSLFCSSFFASCPSPFLRLKCDEFLLMWILLRICCLARLYLSPTLPLSHSYPLFVSPSPSVVTSHKRCSP